MSRPPDQRAAVGATRGVRVRSAIEDRGRCFRRSISCQSGDAIQFRKFTFSPQKRWRQPQHQQRERQQQQQQQQQLHQQHRPRDNILKRKEKKNCRNVSSSVDHELFASDGAQAPRRSSRVKKTPLPPVAAVSATAVAATATAAAAAVGICRANQT